MARVAIGGFFFGVVYFFVGIAHVVIFAVTFAGSHGGEIEKQIRLPKLRVETWVAIALIIAVPLGAFLFLVWCLKLDASGNLI